MPRTAASGVQPNTLSWPPMKPASISGTRALLKRLCCNSTCGRPSVPALQAPCRHRGFLLPRNGQNNGTPGRRWIATPLALAEAERSTNSVANRKDERTARPLAVLGGGFPAPSAAAVQLIPGMKRFPHQRGRPPRDPLDPREYMRQRRLRRLDRNNRSRRTGSR